MDEPRATPLVPESIDDRIIAAVHEALDPYIKRLAQPEPLVCSVTEAARLLCTSTNTIRRLVNDDVLPIVPHMGGRILIPRRALHHLVDSAAKQGPDDVT